MRKKLLLIALAVIMLLCLAFAAACSGPSDQTGGPSNPTDPTEPSLQEQFEAFDKLLRGADSFEVVADVTIAGESQQIVVSVAGDRYKLSRPISGKTFEYYGLYKEGFVYELAFVGGQKNQSNIYYSPERPLNILEALDIPAYMVLGVQNFYDSLCRNLRTEGDKLVFTAAGAQNGTVTLSESGAAISFTAAYVGEVRIAIGKVGTNTVDFGALQESEFTGDFTAYDRIFAEMKWVMDADTATAETVLSYGSEKTSIHTGFSAGEMLQTTYAGTGDAAPATMAEAYIKSGDAFVYVLQDIAAGGAPSVKGLVWEGRTVADIFVQFDVTDRLFNETYFVFEAGSEEKVVLSEAGKKAYPYCDSLLIDLSQEGRYTVSITFKSQPYGYPEAAEIVIESVGEPKFLVFSESFKQCAEQYRGGVLYSLGETNAVAEYASPFSVSVVVADEITVGGKTYKVTSLGASFAADAYFTELVLPAGITNLNAALARAPALEKIYFGGTAAQFDALEGASFYGRPTVYYYAEEQPSAAGYYWRWNEEGTAPEAWPNTFAENFAALTEQLQTADSFKIKISVGKYDKITQMEVVRSGDLMMMSAAGAVSGYALIADGYVYAMIPKESGYERTVSAAKEEETHVFGMIDMFMWDILYIDDFNSAVFSQVAESGSPAFEIVLPGSETREPIPGMDGWYLAENGSITLTETGMIIACDAYNAFETTSVLAPYALTIEVSDIGTAAVELPGDLSVEDFTAGVSALDLFMADLNYLMQENSAQAALVMGTDAGEVTQNYELSGGEMLCTYEVNGERVFGSAVIEKGYKGFIKADYSGGETGTELNAVLFSSNTRELGFTVRDIFEVLGLYYYDPAYFEMQGETTVVLSEEGKAAYDMFGSFSVDLSVEGQYTLTAELLPEQDTPFSYMQMIISGIGTETEIDFPQEIADFVDEYYSGLMGA